jgi:drug/metabolite transporter (DMT)-like permease
MTSHHSLIGIVLMVLSCALLSSKDGLAKTFLGDISPVHLIWFQYVGNFLVMALVAAPRHGWAVIRPRPLAWQFVRGTASASAVCMLYWALLYIPLADATAVFMLAPVIVAALSPFVLGEHLGASRMIAVGVGFLGVLVILRPGFGGDATGYYIGTGAGMLLALYYIANRRLVKAAAPLLNVTHNALTGAVALTFFLPLFWQSVPVEIAPKIAGVIALAVVGQGCAIFAFHHTPAPVLAPYSYSMLVFAAIIGYAWFGNVPDLPTSIGIALIVGAGLYIANRERQLVLQGK